MNKLFNIKDYECLIGHSNPFGYALQGRILFFRDGLKSVYLFTMIALYYEFPRGYVDLVQFVRSYTTLSWPDACRFCKCLKVYGLGDCIELHMCDRSRERAQILAKVMRALHSITHTSFSESYLQEAIVTFDKLVEAGNILSPFDFKDIELLWP